MGHNSYVTHVDFSADSSMIRSTCGAYELLFHSVADGSQETQASNLKDTDWASETCTLGWGVQGIWPAAADGTDVNAVDRTGDLLATSDDFGKVKLFNYPCLTKGAEFVEGKGHSSHVTNVRFINDNEDSVVSVGGNDRSIIVWASGQK